jgi:ribosomal-protein-alanine N-acetyltransferase
MSVRLRAMRWWDVAPALPLEAELFGAEAWTAETWWAELAQPGRHYLVAEDVKANDNTDDTETTDDTEPSALVGYGGVLVNGADADIMTVAVAPARQGRRYGEVILQALLDLAAERGARQVLLEVRADNVAAQRLYERLGFQRIAVRRGYYRTPDGSVDAWVMRRRPLSEPAPALHSAPDSLPR